MHRKAPPPRTPRKPRGERPPKDVPDAVPDLQSRIHHIRGLHVMLDEDLAKLYHVDVHRLNEQVKRNSPRFPASFCFRLTEEEAHSLRSQFAILNESYHNVKPTPKTRTAKIVRGHHRKFVPFAFTEQGVAMLSAVLRSETAVRVSIRIMQAFVEMRRVLHANASMFQQIDTVEKRQIGFEVETTHKFDQVFSALERARETGIETPKEGIFYDGQIHDAHAFVSGLIRSAKSSIVLIDNFIDETVLTVLAKRGAGVSAILYTRKLSETLRLDLNKHNAQYPPVEVRELSEAHDRFLILDGEALYHFGASLKDLGKKWFAFSRFEQGAESMLERLGVYGGLELKNRGSKTSTSSPSE